MSDSVRPIDGSPPGCPVPGTLQARTLEWVAISSSHAWKWKVKVKSLSRALLLATPWTGAYQAPPSMGFSRQEYWSGVPLPSPKALELSPNLPIPHQSVEKLSSTKPVSGAKKVRDLYPSFSNIPDRRPHTLQIKSESLQVDPDCGHEASSQVILTCSKDWEPFSKENLILCEGRRDFIIVDLWNEEFISS